MGQPQAPSTGPPPLEHESGKKLTVTVTGVGEGCSGTVQFLDNSNLTVGPAEGGDVGGVPPAGHLWDEACDSLHISACSNVKNPEGRPVFCILARSQECPALISCSDPQRGPVISSGRLEAPRISLID